MGSSKTSNTPIPIDLVINTILEHVFSEKDVGVIFKSNLTFEEHNCAASEESKLNSWFDSKEFFHLSYPLFKQLYTTFVRTSLGIHKLSGH